MISLVWHPIEGLLIATLRQSNRLSYQRRTLANHDAILRRLVVPVQRLGKYSQLACCRHRCAVLNEVRITSEYRANLTKPLVRSSPFGASRHEPRSEPGSRRSKSETGRTVPTIGRLSERVALLTTPMTRSDRSTLPDKPDSCGDVAIHLPTGSVPHRYIVTSRAHREWKLSRLRLPSLFIANGISAIIRLDT